MRTTDRCPAGHKHDATQTCYTRHHCRCTPCRTFASTIRTTRRKQRAYGRFVEPRVPSAPVREWIKGLFDSGIPVSVMAEISGVSPSTIGLLLWKHGTVRSPMTSMLRVTAEKLLAIQPQTASEMETANVSVVPTVRRLQALMVLGWSQSRLADHVGLKQQSLSRIMTIPTTTTVRVHNRVAEVFEQLWDVQPSADNMGERISVTRTKRLAAARHWLPPMAWDDIATDTQPPLPPERLDVVDEVLIEIAMAGERVQLNAEERRIAVARLHEKRLSDTAIADTLHLADRTVLRIRGRLGLSAAVGANGQPIAA